MIKKTKYDKWLKTKIYSALQDEGFIHWESYKHYMNIRAINSLALLAKQYAQLA